MKPRRSQRRSAEPTPFDALEPISDETAAAIAQLLSDLHVQFESRFLGHLLRHADANRPPPKDPTRPWLTGPPETDEPF